MMISKSSAYKRMETCGEMAVSFRARGEMSIANIEGERGQPCLTPDVGFMG